jgi:hypothetical protein
MSTMKPSRRALVASIASGASIAAVAPAVAVTPLSGAAAEPDPIFAAIDAHRRAERMFGVAVRNLSALEEALPGQSIFAVERVLAGRGSPAELDDLDPRMVEACQRKDQADDVAHQTAFALLTTQPKTVRGAIALLEYWAEATGENPQVFPESDLDGNCLQDFGMFFARSLVSNAAHALANLGAAA